MNYKKGDIVIVKFPFIVREQGKIQKGRPALVISDNKVKRRYKDVIIGAITSQVPNDIMELEIIIEPIKATGLAKKSLLRLDFIMTVPEDIISRKIGELPEDLMIEVACRLKGLFGLKTN